MARGDDKKENLPLPPRKNPFRQEILSGEEIEEKERQAAARERKQDGESASSEQRVSSYSQRLVYFSEQRYPDAEETQGRVRENLQGLRDMSEILKEAVPAANYQPLLDDINYFRGFLFALWNESSPPEASLAHLKLTREDRNYALAAHQRLLQATVTASILSDDMEKSHKLTYAISALSEEIERIS